MKRIQLTDSEIRASHDGMKFRCPECDREHFLGRAVFGHALTGDRECECGVRFELELKVLTRGVE